MPKLQPASRKELSRIARGSCVLTAGMLLLLWVLSLTGVVRLTVGLILSGIFGAGVAILNFGALCYTVQLAAAKADERQRRGVVQLSYNLRLLVQGVWCLLCLAVRPLHPVAGILPLLFPRFVIYYLQITGVYQSEAAQDTIRSAAAQDSDAADAERPSDERGETNR